MKTTTTQITVSGSGKGLTEFTGELNAAIRDSGITQGLCTVFVTHTSASLIIQENADPSVRRDLDNWLERLVPENDSLYTHTDEGPDDMPAHIKGALTQTSIGIPIIQGKPSLGTWQGIFLWEHRRARSRRKIVINLIGE